MRIKADELRQFARTVPPAPAPIEPLLQPEAEAALIAKGNDRDPTVAARRDRVVSLLRRPAPPEGADADLVVLLAVRRALPISDREDFTAARRRLAEIARSREPSPLLLRVFDDHGITPGEAEKLADALLAPVRPADWTRDRGPT
jgi:hypothetical protein